MHRGAKPLGARGGFRMTEKWSNFAHHLIYCVNGSYLLDKI